MSHTTTTEKKKLLGRVSRIRGQLDAIEKALQNEEGCSKILHHIAGCRGAMNGLMAEVVEGHIRSHIVEPHDGSEETRAQAAEDVIDLINSYLK